MDTQIKDLTCILCRKTPEHEEIFISKVDDEEHIEASMCMRCAEHSEDTRKEMYGGWVVVKRIFNTFYALDIDGNFLNEITYYKI